MRALLAAVCLASLGIAQDPPPQTLFDGVSLQGWRGDPAVWSVREGCIVGSTVGKPVAANTFLVLDGRKPRDFVLSMRVQLEGGNNSGIQYRSRELPGGAFAVAGYQCDVNGTPEHLGMLYDERGSGGIVAPQGVFVRWSDAGVQRLGAISHVRRVDLSQWHEFAIHARGDLVWHTLDGVLTAAVHDVRKAAPRAGVIALQVHAGEPMTVRFRDVRIVEYTDAAAFERDVPVPAAVRALLRREQLAVAAPASITPMWIWDASPQDGEEVFYRRALELPSAPPSASLVVACDNHCRVYVNGEKLGASDEWESPLRLDAAKVLRAGENVIAVHAINDGGPGALAARLSWQQDGVEHELVTDATWRCSDDDPDGWNTAAFDHTKWASATVLAAMGDANAPWTRVHGARAFATGADPSAPQIAVVAPGITFHGDDVSSQTAVQLLDVPRALGSWVSLCADAKGRLYASDQRAGLYRIVPAAELGEPTTVERVGVELGGAHGLLWFRDALYAVVNCAGSGEQSGLYRLRDTDGDDALDRVELLQALDGDGEHGAHSVVVAPDGEHLLVVCGNQTKLPPLAASRVPTNWQEDRLLPRLDDPNPYWEGHSPPGGWVCQCDADGKHWELICCGFRNSYDLAVLPNGQVLTFDSDMEWDMGLPWYRPTRLLGVYSGLDYGWRIGSAKWPADYPEAPASLHDVGPGSPTGMAYVPGLGLLALDWTFGTVYRDRGPWLVGAPLPLADVACVEPARGPDSGSCDVFFVTGGRGLPSALLRVRVRTAVQDSGTVRAQARDIVAKGKQWGEPVAWSAVETRPPAQILADAMERGVKLWDTWYVSPLPFARIALERMPVAEWREQVFALDRRYELLHGLLALARQGGKTDLQHVLDAIGKVEWKGIVREDRIAWLRVHALALLRLGPVNDVQRAAIAERLLPLLPADSERQDQDLVELLAYVDAPGLLDKAVPLLSPIKPSPVPKWAGLGEQRDVYGSQYAGVIAAMAGAMPPVGQIAIADALRTVKHGWTLEQRRTYFTFLGEARKRKGGASYDGYLKKIIDAAWATCSPAEQQALADVVGKAKADAPKFRSTPPQGPGRDWQLGDADALLREGLGGADLARGHNLFHAVGCASCHYFAGEGGNHGPDLTSLGNKFAARDVLEAIVEPGKVISEQYAGQVLTKKDGTTLFGFATKTHHGDVEVYEVMPAAADAELVRVPVADVEKRERSPLSPMPPDLVDALSAAELRDLLAFLLSRGQR